ncbi:hypothetical protein Pst134EA_007365 [Puccinia striiformis f. sp. tritici]|nr:hypothetical protein Pst134EA_007365 [Puccinia striiformis f. sp. tritici]KAH9470099.1 hypothetical protein Pst134EA_007365 [Puccinia striiformis f. sp. tritici]
MDAVELKQIKVPPLKELLKERDLLITGRQEQEQQDEQQDDVDDDKEKEEEELGQAGLAAASGVSYLYLDTVNQDTLDFDFKRLCSVTLNIKKQAYPIHFLCHPQVYQSNKNQSKISLSFFLFVLRFRPVLIQTSDNHQHRSYRFIHFHVLINTMNPNEINQFLRLNSGKNEFQESFLAPSHPAIEQGDSCRLFFKPTAPPHPVLSQLAYHDP